MGKSVADNDYTETLMTSLPPSYDPAIQAISSGACLTSKTLTPDLFEQIIDEYEQRQIKIKHTETKDEALAANSSQKNGKDKDKRNVECFNCV
jgi:hypothetical protein